MNRGIYTTATGMIGSQRHLDVIANNLANASTNGFKRDEIVFADTLRRELNADGGLGRRLGPSSAGAEVTGQYTVFEVGALTATNNPLDLALNSVEGMFAVQNGAGQVRYTRDGAFTINDARELVTRNGDRVLDTNGNPIVLPDGKVSVTGKGEIFGEGQTVPVGQVGVYTGRFSKEGENLFSGADVTPVENPMIESGSIEGSNVNAVDAMIDMITIGRNFELSQKAIQQQDDLLQRLIQSLNER